MGTVKYGSVGGPQKGGSDFQMEEKEEYTGKDRQSRPFLKDFNPKDKEFWDKVYENYEGEKDKEGRLSFTDCIDEIRADRIIEKYDTYDQDTGEGNDPIVLMMTEWYDLIEMKKEEPFGSSEDGFASYERQISKIAKIIINRDYDQNGTNSRYTEYITEEQGTMKTLLHLAADGFRPRLSLPSRKRNFIDIARCLIERDQQLVYVTTHPSEGRKQMPVELALENFDDEMASLLINKTAVKQRIRLLFEYDEDHPDDLPPFQFKTFIEREEMMKTVVAVLDSLISPDWPNLPKDQEEKYQEAWYRVPDIPVRYHFYYNILDGDNHGKAPWDPDFNHRQLSCLQAICLSNHKRNAILHPVIRKLASTKWSDYGLKRILFQTFMYILYLITLSIALLGAVQSSDPTKYSTKTDKFRAFCEIFTLCLTVVYLFTEVDQMEKERKQYFFDPFNYVDMIGILSLIVVVPLRFTDSNAQWYLATIAYISNFIRIFKFFPANKQLGLYCSTLYSLLVNEVRAFAAVYVVILFTFTGGTYLALRATTAYNAKTGFASVGVKGFLDILLRGFRALAETNGFNDSYDSFHAFVIAIVLIGMLVIMIFLINILIAQLSTTYESAEKEAKLAYDVDKALFVTRLENSRFLSRNLRVRHYKDGEFVNDNEEIKELLEGWDILHPDSKKEEAGKIFK